MLNYIRTRRGDLGCPLILSSLIHSIGILLLLSTAPPASKQRPIVIELIGDLKADSDHLPQKAGPKPIAEQSKPVSKAESPSPFAEAKEQVQEESSVSVPVQEEPVQPTVVAANAEISPLLLGDDSGVSAVPSVVQGGSGNGDETGQGGRKGDGLENAKNLYLKEHFGYIRDTIIKNISYPYIARKRGLTGKVVVSFIVCERGFANDIKIVESSGYSILDNNAIETIKKSSPFPKPPVRAQLVMPIVYKML